MVGELPAPLGAGVFCVYSGVNLQDGTVGTPASPAAQLGLEPPRFCAACGRRMTVQIRPDGWRATCSRHGSADSADVEEQR
jgi:hypothetical protein